MNINYETFMLHYCYASLSFFSKCCVCVRSDRHGSIFLHTTQPNSPTYCKSISVCTVHNAHHKLCKFCKWLKITNFLSVAVFGTSRRLVVRTPCLKKTRQNYFCQNLGKFPPILIIFDRQTSKCLQFYVVYSFSISSNLCCHTTL